MSADLRLAYLGFEVRDLAVWETFAADVLGLMVEDRTEEGMRLRCDD